MWEPGTLTQSLIFFLVKKTPFRSLFLVLVYSCVFTNHCQSFVVDFFSFSTLHIQYFTRTIDHYSFFFFSFSPFINHPNERCYSYPPVNHMNIQRNLIRSSTKIPSTSQIFSLINEEWFSKREIRGLHSITAEQGLSLITFHFASTITPRKTTPRQRWSQAWLPYRHTSKE